MWSYFWFRTYLYGKDPLSFTGPEHYAFQVKSVYKEGGLGSCRHSRFLY